MHARYPAIGALIAVVIFFLGVLTTGVPLYVVILVGIILGVGVTAGLWAVERTIRPEIGRGQYLWGALVLVSVAAAVWAEETANVGCSGTLNDTRRVLATLALVAIGASAFWLPSSGMRSMFGHGSPLRRAGLLIVDGLWLLIWGFLWFVVWRVMFGCVD